MLDLRVFGESEFVARVAARVDEMTGTAQVRVIGAVQARELGAAGRRGP